MVIYFINALCGNQERSHRIIMMRGIEIYPSEIHK